MINKFSICIADVQVIQATIDSSEEGIMWTACVLCDAIEEAVDDRSVTAKQRRPMFSAGVDTCQCHRMAVQV